jgi:signal transduction histidine kinase/ligand-binding sensor domain-containing protein
MSAMTVIQPPITTTPRRPLRRRLALLWTGALLAAACAASAAPVAAARPFWRSSLSHTAWTSREGAPSSANALAQDRTGMLWFAASDGLFRFDGMRFERIDEIGGNKLLSSNVRTLALFGDALWVGYSFGGISVFEHGAVRHYGEAEGVPSSTIFEFVEAGDGGMWFSCSIGIFWRDGQRWRQVSPDDGLPAGAQPGLSVLQDGTLLVNHATGLFRSVPGTHRFRRVDGPAAMYGVQVTRDGNVIMRKYGQTPQLFDPGSEKTTPLRLPGKAALVYSLNRDSRDAWWIGYGDGMRLYDADFHLKKQLLAPQNFSGLGQYVIPLEDREGNIWFITENGVDRIRETRLTLPDMPARRIHFSVTAGTGGEVWVNSNTEMDTGAPRAFAIMPDGRRIDSAMASATASTRDADGNLWFGNFDQVWRLREGKIRKWPLPPALRGQPVQALAMADDGQLWVSVARRGVHTLQDGVWQPGGGDAALAKRTAVSLHADAKGRLWFGYTNNAMALLQHGVLRHFGPADGLAVGNVLSMYSRRGTLWVGGDQGLVRLEGDRFRRLNDGAGRPFAGIAGLVETAAGELWLHVSGSLLRIDAADLAAARAGGRDRVAAEPFDHLDGHDGATQQIRPLNSLVETDDERLWYATTSSVGWIDPRRIVRNALAPTPLVTALATDSERYRVVNGLELPEHTHNLQIDFTAAVLTIPERARFRTRLIGQDHVWRDAGTRRQAFYTNLGPGDYRFEVMAANEDGLWSVAPASLGFHIAPAFYQTLWFRLACAALLAGAVYLLYLRRLAYLTARVVERMRERLDERERIARTLHDTFLQSVHGLILRFHSIKGGLAKNDAMQQQIDAALDAADAVVDEGRDQLMELRTHHACAGELAPTLSAAAAAACAEQGVTFSLREQGTRRALRAEAQDELFAIAREAIANALRHSGSADIAVELGYEASRLTLAIRDRGTGLDEAVRQTGQRDRHWGLTGMRERAARIGAKLAIHSVAGAGTSIEIALRAGLAYR